ncbi:hypothetical protein MesoLjLc_49490 [Mesorhizobium sp. L-8-10]|uniref:hypothetical protein n=1 Tax=Mesorhizobium sp. L-8-10 TaxID=2744523 RepID=UPI0019273AC3|nr:hypothetical protein [Mesorhizobium sp. L-8-10]BCH33019.1 hypothetical protein MesoLjLc_49490 [Mesorhizobium sp. L-8-10]
MTAPVEPEPVPDKIAAANAWPDQQGEVRADAGFKASGNDALFLKALLTALEANGVTPPPTLGLPASLKKVVHCDHVRVAFRDLNPGDGDDADKHRERLKKALQRTRERLHSFGIIAMADPYVWPTGRPVKGIIQNSNAEADESEQLTEESTELPVQRFDAKAAARIGAMIRLLGSDDPGEVAALVRAIRRMLDEAGASLEDLAQAVLRPEETTRRPTKAREPRPYPPPGPLSIRFDHQSMLRIGRTLIYEHDPAPIEVQFIVGLTAKARQHGEGFRLTVRQEDWLLVLMYHYGVVDEAER